MAKAADNAERSAFLRDLKKRTNELAAAAKKEATSGFLSDEELINVLGLSETKKQFVTKVSRVRYGLDKHKTPYFSFNYVITDTEGEGTSVSTFFGLGGKTKEEREKKDARLCATFQRLGIDTTKFSTATVTDKLVESADKLTMDKPIVVLSLYTWGDDPKKPRLGVDIVSVRANKGPKGKSKPAEDEVEEEQYENAEESEEVEEAEEEAEDIDYASYVGYEAEFDTGEAVITVAATEYDEENGLFTVEDENGDQYEASFEDLNFGE
jgi:hypothetical protein